MKTPEEISNKIIEILEKQEVPLPEFNYKTETGRSRLIMYFNKYKTDETHAELTNFLKT